MSDVQLPQGQQKRGLLDTAMMGLQAYGTVSGIQRNNAESDAMKRRMKMMQDQQGNSSDDSED